MNHRLVTILCTAFISCCFSFSSGAQNPDSTFIATLQSELLLSDIQLHMTDSIVRSTSQQLSVIDKSIMRTSREEINQQEKDQKLADLQQRKKTLRETRDFSIQLLLTPAQKKIYEEKIKPSKPAVLHMGMNHDRANCNVCLPK